MKIATILGTRPEIIKLSPVIPIFEKEYNHIIIHTGQHYSYNMDKVFFEDLELRKPDYTLNVGSGTHAQQTGEMMIKIEEVLLKENPDLVVVQGDTNSTLAGALTASKLHITVAHVEAGCRSFENKMPEEINRILVDHCADILFAPDEIAFNNLIKEGISKDKIHLVGNTSIDACIRVLKLNQEENLNGSLKKYEYILVTLHRQENTELDELKGLIRALNIISRRMKILFPVHLRTRKIMDENKIKTSKNLILLNPLGYTDFIRLLLNSKFVMTDSGGIQEEAAVLDVPCLILRDNTEWMYLVDIGKNVLLGTDEEKITGYVDKILDNEHKLDKMRHIKAPISTGAAQNIISVLRNIQ